jgi:hypothetical protein
MEGKLLKNIGFDESFKILATHFFSRFSKVITEFELINLPKKADVLVVETDKPITRYVRIFDYFKAFNIIEFKSVNNPFRVAEDLHKILIYAGGLLLNEKKGDDYEYSFTVLSSRKPVRFLRSYKKDVQKVKNGVYLIKTILQVPVYVICANEVEGDLDRELALIKEFSTGNERVRFIEEVFNESLKGDRQLKEYVHIAFSLYRSEINRILTKKGVSMTIVEKNIRAWNEQLGLKDAYKKEGELGVAKKMLERGDSVEEIMEVTDLTREEVLDIKKEIDE